jgi:Ca-activated chloride channel family protein
MTLRRNSLLAAAAVLVLAACESQTGVAPPPPPPPAPPPPPPPMYDSVAVTGARLAMEAAPAPMPQPMPGDIDREEYEDVDANPIVAVAEEPVSTFSIDVDTASYAVTRRYLNDGVLPPRDAIRPEEVINYFDYAYPLPASTDAPFAATTTVTGNPWNADTQLLHIGVQGYDIVPQERPRANLVFLIDVSGSMNAPDKLPLAIQGLRLMLGEMDPDDTISIVVYASASGVVLEPTPVSERGRIEAALDSLSAGGSTAGGEGLRLAYAMAERNFDDEAVNRVIMVTDGDFNVGITQDERLEDFVARKRETGIYLSVMGFGRGNYNDALMQTIAQAGNGTAGYVDTLQEARRLLVEEASSTLFPIANDVKIQVEFNPARVAEYRLIGYETRALDRADFNNDAVDAGEIGSGHSVTAIYEITPPDSPARMIDPLRYGGEEAQGDPDGEFAFLRIRYKQPGEDESNLIEAPVTDAHVRLFEEAGSEVRFAVAAAGYAQLLRGDPFLNGFSYDDVIEIAQSARGDDPFGYRAEFVQLARLAESASAQAGLNRGGRGE